MSESTPTLPSHPAGWAIASWGVGGVCLVLLSPIVRLSTPALEAITSGLTPLQWGVAVVWAVFMLYSEGYRGFHKQFSPRVVVRALALAGRPAPLPVLLAPFTCMGLIHATRKRKIISWMVLSFIVVLVVGVRQLPSPWRGIIDLGVVLGLTSGLLSILYFWVSALFGRIPTMASDMPDA